MVKLMGFYDPDGNTRGCSPRRPRRIRRALHRLVRVRVLIAEDETIIRLDLRDAARAQRLRGLRRGEGRRGGGRARSREQPDVAILDVKMPRLDGIEAARRILEERPIPIVMLTAYGHQELVSRAVEAGVFGYLVKPFREQDLVPAIHTARARHEELQALRDEAESLAEALAARKAIERAKGLLMEKEGLSEQDAFARLRKASQLSGRPLKVVAEALLATFEDATRPRSRAASEREQQQAPGREHAQPVLALRRRRLFSGSARGHSACAVTLGPGEEAEADQHRAADVEPVREPLLDALVLHEAEDEPEQETLAAPAIASRMPSSRRNSLTPGRPRTASPSARAAASFARARDARRPRSRPASPRRERRSSSAMRSSRISISASSSSRARRRLRLPTRGAGAASASRLARAARPARGRSSRRT